MSTKKESIRNLLQKKVSTSPDSTTAKQIHAEPELQEPVNTDIQKPTKKATFDLDSELHTELKVLSARQGRPMVDIVQEALRAYIRRL